MNEIPDKIDYQGLVQDALRTVVRRSLQQVATHGLPGAHHFYIAFSTDAPDVVLSTDLRERYPETITIVLQEDFRDLEVERGGFGVTLRFGGRPQRIYVPWLALVSFYDPSEQFALRFESGGVSARLESHSGVVDDDLDEDGFAADGQANPRPPVQGLLAAADRLEEEKARQAKAEAARGGTPKLAAVENSAASDGTAAAESSSEDDAAASPGRDDAEKGAEKATEPDSETSDAEKKKRPTKKRATKKSATKKSATKAGKNAEKDAEAETSEEPTDDDGQTGGVVVSFEDFRRR